MNILLIVMAIILVWRVATDMKKGVVRATLALINVLFAAMVIGLLCVAVNAYHAEHYLAIVIAIVIIAVLSIIYSIIKVVCFPAKVVAKLPIISSVDKLLGVVTGVAETLIAFWVLCYAIMYVDIGVFREQIITMIGESRILTFLYEYNLIGVMLETVKVKIGL